MTVAAASASTTLWASPPMNRASSAAAKLSSVQFAGTGARPVARVRAARTSATSGRIVVTTIAAAQRDRHRAPGPAPARPPAGRAVRAAARPTNSASADPTTTRATTTSVAAIVVARTNAAGSADSARSW